MIPAITIMQNALVTEILEMKDLVTEEIIADVNDGESGISLPVNETPDEPTYDHEAVWTTSDLTDSINNDCLKVAMTLEEALKTVSHLCADDKDATIYGAIWVDASKALRRINVLHPLVVYSLIHKMYDIELSSPGTLYIYEWMEHPGRVEADIINQYIEVWDNTITTAKSWYKPQISHRIRTNLNQVVENVRKGVDLDSIRVQFSPTGNNPEKVVTPVHLLTRSMLFPYYGVVYSEMRSRDSSYYSRDLTPFGSCNINHPEDIKTFGGTCTGNLSNSVYSSLRTLSNANTGSPHHTDVIYGDATEQRTFVKISQEYACVLIDQMLKKPETVEETEVKPEVEPEVEPSEVVEDTSCQA